MDTKKITMKDFFGYSIAKNILMSLLAIVILVIAGFLYVFFAKYNSYKPKVAKINQNYTLDINFEQLNTFQDNFFDLKDLEFKTDKDLLYKIYDGPVITNGYDKAKARIIEGKTHITDETTIIKKRTVDNNKKINSILEKIRNLRKNKK